MTSTRKAGVRLAVAALGLLMARASAAVASDLPSAKSAPAYAPIDELFDPFLVRVRALGVLPNGGGSTINGGPIYGASLTENVVPELDVSYFFTKHWAAEIICCGVHTSLSGSLTPGGSKVDFANTFLVPATVTLQYHLATGQWDPYVGVGVNYTWFLGTASPLTQSLGFGNAVNIHSSAGLAFQAGMDYYLTEHWVLNADAKYLVLNTDGNTPFGQNTVHINANTWLVGLGIGYRFGLAAMSAPIVAKY